MVFIPFNHYAAAIVYALRRRRPFNLIRYLIMTTKEMTLEEELSAARATVAMLEEDGERLDWIQSMLSGDDQMEPDLFCVKLLHESRKYTSIRSTIDAMRYQF